MNPLIKAIEDARVTLIETLFKEVGNCTLSCFRCALRGDKPTRVSVITELKLKQLLSSSHLAILETMEKEVEGMKRKAFEYKALKEECKRDIGTCGTFCSEMNGRADGYKEALSDILVIIKEAKEVIK